MLNNVNVFNDEQERLRQEFIESETERIYGTQNITSQSSTVNAAGQRVPVGGIAGTLLTITDVGGEVFLRLLKMLVIPLVVTSVMSG